MEYHCYSCKRDEGTYSMDSCVSCGKLATFFHNGRCANQIHSVAARFCHSCMPACTRCKEHEYCKEHRLRCDYCNEDKIDANYCSVCIQCCAECQQNVCALHDGVHKEQCDCERSIRVAPICPVLGRIAATDRKKKRYLECEGGRGFNCALTENFGLDFGIKETFLVGGGIRHCHCSRFTHIWLSLNMEDLMKKWSGTSLLSTKFKLKQKHACNAISMPMIPLKGFEEKSIQVTNCGSVDEWDTERKTRHSAANGCHLCHSNELYYPLFQLFSVDEESVSNSLLYIKWFYMCKNGHIVFSIGIP